MPYLPYIEPGLDIILPLSIFIFILNVTRDLLDSFLYCGLIGEIFIGILSGMPITGTSFLSIEIQETVQYLGYLGLICLVFEGGLITDLHILRNTIWLTLSAAMIGILMPMALSFCIMGMEFDSIEGSGYPTAIAAFSAGVSLCSTSLGSTFIILASANLQKTPIGTLIAGAAMIDDILVLVMVEIITALGQGQSDSWTIVRPAIWPKTFGADIDTEKGISRHTGFILSTLMLIVLVTIAACVEGSILLSAFLAGAVVRYTWQSVDGDEDMDLGIDRPTMMFEEYYKPIMDHILVPFFFASIGFSVPVSEMFSGSILWKGIFYACLMFLAKASVGIVVYFEFFSARWSQQWTDFKKKTLPMPEELPQQDGLPEEISTNDLVNQKLKTDPPHLDAIIVGSTMIARGGFGFLVASEAQSSGTLSLSKTPIRIPNVQGLSHKVTGRLRTLDVVEDQIFLVIIWALVLCTIVGPVVSGIAVRKKLVKEREGERCECGVIVGQRSFGNGDEGVGGCHLCL
ncbi:uncharacterized protein EAE97_007795 [Botrytis byssoidea]|uniref:Cation/H+ exchanger transmembrane domain-containing protein n=1 Tax=Botrytis byssoidea TaxID=139641 RepID=A0A9P5M2Y9_9HELO|nr:uncharacterized protein EAE97_007795 [Botrytis byssoidea]KAF7937999.1 hypothetical protein EAE97_007795 [Botrytis byssoidea]